MRSIRVTAVAVMLLVGASQVAAQSQYTDQVFRQLQDIYDDVANEGYYLTNFIVGSMDEGEDDVWTMSFMEDTEYVIHGACDRDCSDIDLSVLTEAGDVVESNILTDDSPVVTFRPAKSARYQIKATMYSCSEEPCYFGLGIFND
jgi:hypothetical protein